MVSKQKEYKTFYGLTIKVAPYESHKRMFRRVGGKLYIRKPDSVSMWESYTDRSISTVQDLVAAFGEKATLGSLLSTDKLKGWRRATAAEEARYKKLKASNETRLLKAIKRGLLKELRHDEKTLAWHAASIKRIQDAMSKRKASIATVNSILDTTTD